MKDQLNMLIEFHSTGDVHLEHEPTIDIPSTVNKLRISLLEEELDEYRKAVKDDDIVAVADALTDLMYVLLGTYVSHGLQDYAEALFSEVHRSNMSKFSDAGEIIHRQDGKVLKPGGFFPPDIKSILNR
jgi:predicted HAD superfamily Cof-like phosphohydrolase